MEFKNLEVKMEGKLGILTINRPEVQNAINLETVNELYKALDFFKENNALTVILTGAGDKVFVSGADVNDLKTRNKFDAFEGINNKIFTTIEKFHVPVIAAVNGFALGGGFELALACDIRIASENAKFGFPETSLGIIPGAGGTQRLPRLVGLGKAKEIVLTGEIFDAQKAENIGLVVKITKIADLMDEAKKIAEKIMARAPFAIRLAKLNLNNSTQTSQDAGMLFEMVSQAVLFETEDKLEGMTAFLEKRKANFKGN
ncbi:enoyl-CoA hydratase/isomerase family protein [bacterium]|nr:enoyl-CoA hydratase/isomerase family protein [bacterium]